MDNLFLCESCCDIATIKEVYLYYLSVTGQLYDRRFIGTTKDVDMYSNTHVYHFDIHISRLIKELKENCLQFGRRIKIKYIPQKKHKTVCFYELTGYVHYCVKCWEALPLISKRKIDPDKWKIEIIEDAVDLSINK